MQSDQQFSIQNPGLKHPGPFHGVEFQPSEVCPKNLIIFDQTQNRSQIMFHPAIAPNFCYPGLDIPSSYGHNNVDKGKSIEKELHSSFGEDSDDINALLGSEEQEECDQDEVSTARTRVNYGSDSSDSCSSYGSKPKKSKLLHCQKSSHCGHSCKGERKRQKTREMVKVLQGIVPGGSNQMNTAAVLDEAIRYLKSLKVEAQKLGVANLNN